MYSDKATYGVRSGKYLLKSPGNAISKTLNFKMSLDAWALQNVTALTKNPRSVLLVSKVAFGKDPFNRSKLQTENDL